jgi:hypothetical protein
MKKIFLITVFVMLSKFTFSQIAFVSVSPDPFDSITIISFDGGSCIDVYLDVLNSYGNKVKVILDGNHLIPFGFHSLPFNGDTLPNGIYYARMSCDTAQPPFIITQFIKNSSVGVKEYTNFKNLKIYPNPTTSIINIVDENNQLQNSTIQIQNYLGQLVFSSPFNSQIDLRSLSAGMYFLTIEDKGNKKTIKIIKQ